EPQQLGIGARQFLFHNSDYGALVEPAGNRGERHALMIGVALSLTGLRITSPTRRSAARMPANSTSAAAASGEAGFSTSHSSTAALYRSSASRVVGSRPWSLRSPPQCSALCRIST